MRTTLALFTDGRKECIEAAIPSALANLVGLDGDRCIFDDSADPAYSAWLHNRFSPDGFVVFPALVRQGFGGAIRRAWPILAAGSDEFVLHLEDDFTFNRQVDLVTMAHTLSCRPYLVQMALRRQPWNEAERAAGGIVEQHPEDFAEVSNGTRTRWLEHRRMFTTNPSLYRRSLCSRGWPDGAESEGRFGIDLFADPSVRCGYWGGRSSGEAVTHIGRERVGSGY